MNRRILLALAIAASASHGTAQAVPVTLQFTATDFYNVCCSPFTDPIPTTPISGTIVWDAADAHSPINSLTSVSMTIDGHSYTLADTGYVTPWIISTFFVLGGAPYGTLSMGFSGGNYYDDFSLAWYADTLAPQAFSYSSSASHRAWGSQTFTNFSISALAVPEVETYAMLLAGLGLLGFAARLRK
ncbi:MAG: hypothetical protein HZC43_04575 [Nitrosomonadales bacterium]|nr:hypothetical protein [Nitrosomonadales bacterium]